MGIQGRTSMMLSAEAERPETLEHLRGIEEYVRSASELTKQLLGFARGGKYEVQVTDLNSLIDRQNRLFGRTRKEIRIQARLDEDLPTVEVDRGQFEQVLLNLYVNAWQAMPGGGDLTVETSNVALGAEEVEAFDGRAGEYVRVRVSDTGRGMDEKTKQRVFEPFFSTREKGRGTGLGLASAYGIIANHGGNIEVASEPGRGSTFTIHLPASGKACEPVVEEAAGIRSGQEVVLLVDDESIVRDVGKAMLERLGYAVHVASAGAEAVERLQDLTVDLVILDLVMPDMGGGETFDRIREIRPEMRVLLSSGYSIDGKAREILARGCNGFIQKPFTMQQLSEKIRGVLETP